MTTLPNHKNKNKCNPAFAEINQNTPRDNLRKYVFHDVMTLREVLHYYHGYVTTAFKTRAEILMALANESHFYSHRYQIY